MPLSIPNASSSTFTIGAKQLVVHEALETTKSLAGSNSESFTPITKVASTPVAGAATITRLAPASRWAAADSRVVNRPVDSITTSTPSSPQGNALGSRSASTAIGPESRTIDEPETSVEAAVRGVVPEEMAQRLRRGQVVDGHHLDVRPHQTGSPKIEAPDAPEAVDAYPYRHGLPTSPFSDPYTPITRWGPG